MPSSHLILCCPLLLLPPIPPSIRVFSNESTLRMRWPKYWSLALASVLPKKSQGWSPWGVGLLYFHHYPTSPPHDHYHLFIFASHFTVRSHLLSELYYCYSCFIDESLVTQREYDALTRRSFTRGLGGILCNSGSTQGLYTTMIWELGLRIPPPETLT